MSKSARPTCAATRNARAMPRESVKSIPGEAFSRTRDDDRLLAEVAARQHGLVARRQLIEAGWSKGSIEKRVRRGRLHRMHAGVYAVGHRQNFQRMWWMAAVLASGPEAVLSHRSAAALWKLRGYSGGA